MKKTKVIFWTATIIFAILMLVSSIPDILNVADAKKFMATLGYPAYITPSLAGLSYWALLPYSCRASIHGSKSGLMQDCS